MVLNADNIRQNIRNQVKKSSKIEQDDKVLISASAKLLTNFNNSFLFRMTDSALDFITI